MLQTAGSTPVQAWCLMTKKSWTMKLLVKHYPAVNQWMKLMNGKSIMLVLLPCVNEFIYLNRYMRRICFKDIYIYIYIKTE